MWRRECGRPRELRRSRRELRRAAAENNTTPLTAGRQLAPPARATRSPHRAPHPLPPPHLSISLERRSATKWGARVQQPQTRAGLAQNECLVVMSAGSGMGIIIAGAPASGAFGSGGGASETAAAV